MIKLKNGQKLACEPCGREVIIDACGASESVLWCCNQPMIQKEKKKTAKKAPKKK
ncbi:MAG: hypothetical protein HQL24_05915 [Candidatus Omnitrophica bacterium]|nr:hypothetical protein [Candidatus Omnitrophota bacterium]